MTGAYVDKSYVYAVARVRYAELKLLDAQALDQLLSADTAEEVLSTLKEKGWGSEASKGPEEVLKAEREKLWDFIDEIVADRTVFDVFRLSGDYNNLKAAIKESVMKYNYPGIYISESTLDPELIRDAVREREYKRLPEDMAAVAEEAHRTYLTTMDGQLCDIICDRACLEAILRAGKASGNSFLMLYAETTVASADIKTAVRAALTGKSREFLDTALAECGTLDRGKLIQAAVSGADAVAQYLLNTPYAAASEELKSSPAAFERWCDNLMTARMKSQLWESFGLGPIAAYILAKENDIKSARIILSGKQNGFPQEMIAERVRDPYV